MLPHFFVALRRLVICAEPEALPEKFLKLGQSLTPTSPLALPDRQSPVLLRRRLASSLCSKRVELRDKWGEVESLAVRCHHRRGYLWLRGSGGERWRGVWEGLREGERS